MRHPFIALACAAIAVLPLAFFIAPRSMAAERAVAVPAPRNDEAAHPGKAVAVLAGGCFWGMEGVFEHFKGVESATAGYAGGAASTATYDQVTTETTGHAEAVRIVYNTAQISYGKLLQIYFSVAHNPTELNRQGPDSGTSYRSAIFAQDVQQKALAQAYIGQLSAAHLFKSPIVTHVETGAFYPAEGYHQHFMRDHPTYPYIVINDEPKVAALKAFYPALYH
ncbi:MAG: peptide-methionine (S)-S-oxide reductase MsrA [Alphaproteobacteria bacterium]|nr:peptide-methionine (S)-S-oxide reductase MsrA [Alphaproteobacteria bacterium]MDE2340008.1 peptide-methionine (S)-S-oxide reductase MsrA [Alphaproteobacteria bacterium]